ncbi:MAG: hypothetical protein ACE5GY_02980 [Thermodesulfobacteriota bacterium]
MLRKLAVLLFLSVLLATGAPAGAEGPSNGVAVVRSEGVALRADNIAEVKRKAIDQALNNAVTSTLADLVKKEGLETEFDIAGSGVMADPFSYILNYRILSEGWITHMESVPALAEQIPESYNSFEQNPGGIELFHIWIEASVDSGRLQNVLAKATLTPGRPTTRITLNIMGVTDYPTFKALVASLERIPTIKDISYSSFYRGRVVLSLKSAGDGQTLSERIAREVPGDFAVIPGGPRMIIIRAASNR